MSELHSVQLNHSRLSYTWLVVHDCMLSSLLQMHANTSHAADPQLKLTMTLSSMLMYLNINLGTPSKNLILHAHTLLSCFFTSCCERKIHSNVFSFSDIYKHEDSLISTFRVRNVHFDDVLTMNISPIHQT